MMLRTCVVDHFLLLSLLNSYVPLIIIKILLLLLDVPLLVLLFEIHIN